MIGAVVLAAALALLASCGGATEPALPAAPWPPGQLRAPTPDQVKELFTETLGSAETQTGSGPAALCGAGAMPGSDEGFWMISGTGSGFVSATVTAASAPAADLETWINTLASNETCEIDLSDSETMIEATSVRGAAIDGTRGVLLAGVTPYEQNMAILVIGAGETAVQMQLVSDIETAETLEAKLRELAALSLSPA